MTSPTKIRRSPRATTAAAAPTGRSTASLTATLLALPAIENADLRLTIEAWTFEQFEKLPRHPKQRNEELKPDTHLVVPQLDHAIVAVYRTFDGKDYKGNGHKRTLRWKTHGCPFDTLIVAVFTEKHDKVNTLAEQIALYERFDSRESVKSAADDVSGSSNLAGIKFKTTWMAAGQNIAAMMNKAADFIAGAPRGASSQTKTDQILFFKDALVLLDSLLPTHRKLGVGYGAGILMFLHEHGTRGLAVVDSYLTGTGARTEGTQRNAISRLIDLRRADSAAGQMGGAANNNRQAKQTYELLELALRTDEPGKKVKPFNFAAYNGRLALKR